MKKTLACAAICAALILGTSGAAFAGEVNGNGKDTRGPANANSECVYSGLEDGSEGGTAGPGNVQNWGHAKDSEFVLEAPRGASDVVTVFGPAGCNAHLHGLK
ncbi:hypothetical protein [Microbacterium sp.]|uniref:hypothetical protein n=1 Tax=Microbacterium sp. TaxID=51671 RepID=UPI002E3312AB|nr:hypothetical protein [Microbacterium sp.]HEX5727940.1 hypothetical protein [Microbacterium sp.]